MFSLLMCFRKKLIVTMRKDEKKLQRMFVLLSLLLTEQQNEF